MTVRPTAAKSVFVEQLESRRLLAVINIVNEGATPNNGGNDGPAIQRAINNSRAGDTIFFPAGTFDVTTPITLRGDRTYLGESGSKLAFAMPTGRYGVNVLGDAQNIVIEKLHFQGSGIHFGQGREYKNVRVHGNLFSDMVEPALKMTIRTDQFSIECNTFQNVRSYGTILSFFSNRLTYRFNRLIDCNHGGHFLAPLDNNVFAFNHMTGLVNMGLEIQSHNRSVARNMVVEGNVIYNWRSTHSHAMGLSVPTSWSVNTTIKDNYVNGNLAPGHTWLNVPGRKPAIGTMIEAIYDSGVVQNNVVGGKFWFCVGAGTNHSPPTYTSVIEGNKFYGNSFTGLPHIVGWPGAPQNPASWSVGTGNQVLPANQMPPPDAWIARTVCGSQPLPNPTPNPNPNPNPTPNPAPARILAPSALTGRALSSSKVELTWRDNSNNELGFKIERSFVGPNGPFTQVGLSSANIIKWTNFGLPANTNVWYRVRAYGSVGHSDYSNVFQIKTPVLGGTTGGYTSSVVNFPTSQTSPFSDLLI